MYKVNHKAVMLVFLLQLLAGAVWYYLSHTLVLNTFIELDKLPLESMSLFIFFVLVYAYFCAWLLVVIQLRSSFSMMMLLIGIWLFMVLPNYAFIGLYLNISVMDSLYLLSYGATNCAIAALILPLWRSSRSIFKS